MIHKRRIMKRNYWLTTHWPPEIDTPADFSVYLYHGTQQVGTDIKRGDRVWIYQSKSGRKVVRENIDGSKEKVKREQGKEGVVALMEVVSKIHDSDRQPEKYEDGSEKWWRWRADTKLINQSGFIPRIELNPIMGYKLRYNYHVFGDGRSGLKRISMETHEAILETFNQHQPPETKPITRDSHEYSLHGHGKGGEGKIHKALKERIAANPSQVLGENGLSLIKIEYPYPTGDRADLILKNSENQYIAVEVEVGVDLSDISGVLQAIKYSRMYAVECRREFEEVKAYLVAHKISNEVIELCKRYGIETFVINHEAIY